MESRHTDLSPVRCLDCGWEGKAYECVHTYRSDGSSNPDGSPTGEVEPVDECPECGSEQLEQLQPSQ